MKLSEALEKAIRGSPSLASARAGGQALAQQAASTGVTKPGLVKKEIMVHRAGKTFTEERMVREGEEIKPVKSKKQDPIVDKKQSQKDDAFDKHPDIEISPEHKQRLNEHLKNLRGIKPGETKDVNGVAVKSLGNSKYGLKVAGKKITLSSIHAVSLIVDKLGSLTSTGTAMIMGDIQGSTVKQEIGVQYAERLVEAKAGDVGRFAEGAKSEAIKDKETQERLNKYLETREKFDKDREFKSKVMQQKRDINSAVYASTLSVQKVDKMNDAQVLNAAQRLQIPINDDSGKVYPVEQLRDQIKQFVPQQTKEEQVKEQEELEDRTNKRDNLFDPLLNPSEKTTEETTEEKPERKQAKTLVDEKQDASKEKSYKDMNEDELKEYAKKVGIDPEVVDKAGKGKTQLGVPSKEAGNKKIADMSRSDLESVANHLGIVHKDLSDDELRKQIREYKVPEKKDTVIEEKKETKIDPKKKVADMNKDELKKIADSLGLDVTGKDENQIRQLLRQQGHKTILGSPPKK